MDTFLDGKLSMRGYPRGPHLVLFLFLLFINDIENEVLSNINMFAVDTSLYCGVEDQTSAAESLNEDLESIHQWSSDWGITFNAAKTKSMLFSRKKWLFCHPYSLIGPCWKTQNPMSILVSLLTQTVNEMII